MSEAMAEKDPHFGTHFGTLFDSKSVPQEGSLADSVLANLTGSMLRGTPKCLSKEDLFWDLLGEM